MTVLFLCHQNAGRSQMAQAFFERVAPGHAAHSGGSSPAAVIHPAVVEVMREVGIDLSGRKPKKVDAELLQGADLVISMGCVEELANRIQATPAGAPRQAPAPARAPR